MEITIGFYNKEEVFVDINIEQNDKLNKVESKLFLLAWYTLQQLNNLGRNPVVFLFEGIFLKKEANWFHDEEPLTFFRIAIIGDYIMESFITSNKDIEVTELMKAQRKLTNQYMIDALIDEILTIFPKLVIRTSEKPGKIFIAKVPPYTIKQEGFGLLGKDINYYVCYSIIALMNKILNEEIKDPSGLSPEEIIEKQVTSVLYNCALLNARGITNIDNQPKLATRLIESIKNDPEYIINKNQQRNY